MTKTRSLRPLTLLAVCLTGATVLAGCNAVDGLLYKYSTTTFDDREALRASEQIDERWIPSDAKNITLRASTIGEDAVILVDSPSDLNILDCVEEPRTTAPSWRLDEAPDAYAHDTVYDCDGWWVLATDEGDGWYGWTM
ncbi:hypothetical protein [Microbacterium phyllosphaerae]|uniref:hypothetical protein n=1 Tax=Microbacterium phyllosphaerae TaxID=124798 RepID=UPI002169E385|nr:hypothetical protein [Microbacterium phyllosphaerae]MCS3442197.1 putative small secreted protein [Microbacterium phyllosphaerae]